MKTEVGVSKPVVIEGPKASWAKEYKEIATSLREIVAEQAIRIDHIGSTSVPDLVAKDVIDIQITVACIDDCTLLRERLTAAGYLEKGGVRQDCLTAWPATKSHQLEKTIFS